jgi:hypothetical protein
LRVEIGIDERRGEERLEKEIELGGEGSEWRSGIYREVGSEWGRCKRQRVRRGGVGKRFLWAPYGKRE